MMMVVKRIFFFGNIVHRTEHKGAPPNVENDLYFNLEGHKGIYQHKLDLGKEEALDI